MIFCIEGQAKAELKLGEMVPDSKFSSQISDGLTLALVLRYPSSVLQLYLGKRVCLGFAQQGLKYDKKMHEVLLFGKNSVQNGQKLFNLLEQLS